MNALPPVGNRPRPALSWRAMPSTIRFLRHFLRPADGAVLREETTYRRDGRDLPATLYRPTRPRAPLPGWVTLHGITARGRDHESLIRFASALAAAGTAVLVPDLPEWRALRVAPRTTVATIRAAVLELDARGLTEPGRIGVMGFSFGATQALVAASDPALEGHLAGVAAWGGYADMLRTARFGFLGEHELDGRAYRAEPDPYGRWILAGNYLTLLPEHRDDGALAGALHGLALHAGRNMIRSWDAAMDPVKEAARQGLTTDQRQVFDLLAPPTGRRLREGERDAVRQLVDRMIPAAIEHEPLLDPGLHLQRVPVPVFLAHGRNDRLIPWTELVRLQRALPDERVRYAGITSLFGHSFGEKRFPTPRLVWEGVRFLDLTRRMLRLV